MDMPTLQGIVNSLGEDLDLPVVLEDADQQPIVHSPHYGLTDQIRRDTIMRRATGEQVVDYFRHYDLAARTDPFIVPGDPSADVLARLCIPVRHHDVTLGYAWVLLPDGTVTEPQLRAVAQAQEALTDTMRMERRARAREAEVVDDLLSADPERRRRGVAEVEAKPAFEAPRPCVVLVCTGPGWRAAPARRAFYSQRWVPDPVAQLRSASADEGVAVLALALGDSVEPSSQAAGNVEEGSLPPLELAGVERGVRQLRRAAEGSAVIVGIGPAVATPADAHRSYRRARHAAQVAVRTGEHAPIATWAGLGIYRHLSQLPREALSDGIDPRLLRLVQAAPEVAATLEAYLDGAGAVGQVADALHIHRTTLYHRLEKVAEAGIDVSSGRDRATSQIGFAALRLLQRWPLVDT